MLRPIACFFTISLTAFCTNLQVSEAGPAFLGERVRFGAPRSVSLAEIINSALVANRISKRLYPLFYAVAHLESRFQADEISRVGAVGLFQLVPSTANQAFRRSDYIDQEFFTIYNPRYRGRHVLYAGSNHLYPMRILRSYAAHLKSYRRRQRKPLRQLKRSFKRGLISHTDYQRRRIALKSEILQTLAEADVRFHPSANANLAISYFEDIRRRYFGRYRCYRDRSSGKKRKGKKFCGAFGGYHGAFLAAAGYHLGIGSVQNLIASSRARSIGGYIKIARRSQRRSLKKNAWYLSKLKRLYTAYRKLMRRDRMFNREDLLSAFPGQTRLADALFRTYPVSLATLRPRSTESADKALASAQFTGQH